MTYREQLRDPRWLERRTEIIFRDSKCIACGVIDAWVDVHHVRYIRGLMAWEYPDDLLVSLCRPCHLRERFTRDGREATRRMQERNNRRLELGLPRIAGDGSELNEYGERVAWEPVEQ